MTDISKTFLIGRLTRDSELSYISTGTAKLTFSVACSESIKKGDKWEDYTSFFDLVLWGKIGEELNKYLIKGKQVGIDGRLKQERWESEGNKRSRIILVVENIQLLGGKKESSTAEIVAEKFGGEVINDDRFEDDIPF